MGYVWAMSVRFVLNLIVLPCGFGLCSCQCCLILQVGVLSGFCYYSVCVTVRIVFFQGCVTVRVVFFPGLVTVRVMFFPGCVMVLFLTGLCKGFVVRLCCFPEAVLLTGLCL